MDRQDFYKFQVVGQADLDTLEDHIELADVHGVDAFSLGAIPIRGLVPTPDGATLVLPISAGVGIATDTDGNPRLVRLVADGTINLTSALPSVNPKWVAVCLKFVRLNSNTVVDGDNVSLSYNNDESSQLIVVQGAENGSKPSIPVDHVPICDFRLTVGQTALTTAKCDRSRARPSYGRQGVAGGVAAQIADMAGVGVGNCAPDASEPASMIVHVRAGRIGFQGASVVVSPQTITVPASPSGGKHRITLVWLDTSGTIQQSHGSEVVYASPAVAPSHVGRYPLAEIDVRDDTTTITASMVVDVRPFARTSRDVPQRYELVAVGGETDITPGWTFVVGAHALWVYDNGALLSESDYTEAADGLSITLGAGATAGHVITLLAQLPGDANPVVAHEATHQADGTDEFLLTTLGGLVAPGFEAYSTGTNAITIKPFAAVVNGRMRASSADITLAATLAAMAACDGGTIDASSWRYAYAYWSSGAMQIEISVSAPDAQRRTKTGDATRTYLFAIRFNASTQIRLFLRKNRTTFYRSDFRSIAPSGTALANTCVLALDNSGDSGAVSLADVVPSHAHLVEVLFETKGALADQVAGLLATEVGLSAAQYQNVVLVATKWVRQRCTLFAASNTLQVTQGVAAVGNTSLVHVVSYED